MNPVLEKKLRFGDVAYAIDSTPKALRNWLQRDQIKLFSEAPEEGWREFSFADVAVLAIVRKIVDFGSRVEEASWLAHAAIQQMCPVERFQNIPPGALATIWHGRTLAIWVVGDTWHLNSFGSWQDAREIAQALTPSEGGEPANSYIAINVEAVLRRAFDRATESLVDSK